MKIKIYKRLIISFFILLYGIIPAFSQLTDNYTPIEPKGKIPERFFQSLKGKTSVKIVVEDEQLSKRQKREFKTTTQFALQELFLSGDIYYNDPCTPYVRQITKNLLKHLPESAEVDVFISRFVSPNAAVWQDGTLILNIGLLAQLENEAQLAFVIAHEIGHHQLHHPFRQYIRTQQLSNIQKRTLDNLKAQVAYNRQNEQDADAFALDLLAKAGYTTNSAHEVLNLLTRDRFDTNENLLKDLHPSLGACKEIDIAPILNEGSVKSHFAPNMIAQRQERLPDTQDGQLFLLSNQNFKRMNDIAQFEVIENAYRGADYTFCLYRSLVLKKEYPNNIYLKSKIAESLFQLYLYKKRDRLLQLLRHHKQPHYSAEAHEKIICYMKRIDENAFRQMAEQLILQYYKSLKEQSESIVITQAKFTELVYGIDKARPYFDHYLEYYKGGKHTQYVKKRLE